MANILIVDDDRVSRLLIHHMLTSAGHEVVDADDITTALEQVAAANFDAVISDFEMPGGSGLDLLDGLAGQADADQIDRPRFALITGHHEKDEFSDDRVHEVDAFMTKPVSSNALAACIEELFAENVSCSQS